MREFFQKRRPEKSIVNHFIEHARGVDNAVQFVGAFLRRRYFRFDFRPLVFDCAQAMLDLKSPVGVPNVIEKHQRADADEKHHTDLKGIALTLSLFQNLLVKEVKMKGHWLFSVRDIRMPPHRRH